LRLFRPIQTRFRCGSECFSLNLATKSNSPAHAPIGTPSDLPGAHLPKEIGHFWHCPSTACRHTVSGSFDSLNKGSFHLSLTVLVHYRSSRVFSLGRWTSLLPTRLACPVVLKVSARVGFRFAYRGLTSSARPSQTVRLRTRFVTPWAYQLTPPSLTTPIQYRLWTTQLHRFGLFPFRSPLLGEFSLFLGVLGCFGSPGSPRLAYVFNQRYPGIPLGGFPHSGISGSSA
jgi:hypothetical protein